LNEGARIEYRPAHSYVSRGGVKLAAALDRFGLSPNNLTCLDIGASTGGFTEVLLNRGAKRVYAVDVGHDQLHPKLRKSDKVVLLERVNARDLAPALIADPVQAITADVSFISLRIALGPALGIAAPGAWAVLLVKPQFEAGSAGVPASGIIRDATVREHALTAVTDWVAAKGWTRIGAVESPITGKDGNIEYLLAARKTTG
jgi:23S rRNA (cytidine1920-2'-O)/16S rRNA (cytidine1409-2'-O)-methyltransferase